MLILFIKSTDVDERHLLRLGHGEEELNTELSFSKYGRVNSFLVSGRLSSHYRSNPLRRMLRSDCILLTRKNVWHYSKK
jgi:hypothetical protein